MQVGMQSVVYYISLGIYKYEIDFAIIEDPLFPRPLCQYY